ncbi:MAG: immune inhibitor A [Pseudomonadota bacterium]|nr:immune inhibitor A [Pseudomonadota bacterium]
MPKVQSKIQGLTLLLALLLGTSACQKSQKLSPTRNDIILGDLAKNVAEKKAEANKLDEGTSERQAIEEAIKKLLEKLNEKRLSSSLSRANQSLLANQMNENTQLFSLKGKYNVLVIPVQFADVKFMRPEYFAKGQSGKSLADEAIFGENENSLHSYYSHESQGLLDVRGEIAPIVTAPKELVEYGEAIGGSNDKDPQHLVVHALKELMKLQNDPKFWKQFDRWDLYDYDGDNNHYESDGFIDAVVLVYAGKSQASCQRSFDPKGEKPSSKDYPEGPRKKAAVECFNRIWPHRSGISLAKDDPDYLEKGPDVEGLERPSLNGLKINDAVYALDYNMQSETSDVSTFIHEFGHSLTLPDVYATKSEGNSTGEWEIMSSNSTNYAQEQSSYSRLSLGWLSPKIVNPGLGLGSLYLGSLNFVSPERRQSANTSLETDLVTETVGPNNVEHTYDVLSRVPETNEAVYRSAIAMMPPTAEARKLFDNKAELGSITAYSGKFDNQTHSLKANLNVPSQGAAELTFETLYFIETETNFESADPQIKVTLDYDIALVLINGKEVDRLRLLSGDADQDSLVESNVTCEVARVKELRLKVFSKTSTEAETEEFKKKLAVCRTPIWVSKKYDVSALAGSEIELEVRYVTDPGYTELGIVVDNISLGTQKVDFEGATADSSFGSFFKIKDGIQYLDHNQFYLFEYRNPTTDFVSTKAGRSYNFDRNIGPSSQSFFLPGESDSLERFRILTASYQPGVVVWYYNSKYDRVSNNSLLQDGKGYLLVLNSNKKEFLLPSVWKNPEYFDEHGYYNDITLPGPLKTTTDAQRAEFVCFSHTEYYKYLEGVEADCSKYKGTLNVMNKIQYEGRSLIYSRELSNENHPMDYSKFKWVTRPFAHGASHVTGLSPFRPSADGDFTPIQSYKVELKSMNLVPDEALNKELTSYKAVSEYYDLEQEMPKTKRRYTDTVNVEKKGFYFKVVRPAVEVEAQYANSEDSQSNDFIERKPRVKIYFSMKPK